MTSIAKEKKKFRFSRADFGPLELLPLHYDLIFDMDKERVRCIATQTYLSNVSTNELKLNQHDLTVESVEMFEKHSLLGPPPVGLDAKIPNFLVHIKSLSNVKALDYEVQAEERFLIVKLPFLLKKGEEIVIRTVSTCKPTANILEGIYYDYTPDGAPQTMITQCQQYGFQRIVPCVDRMASKTFYTTTVISDERYTNVVTNGDLAPGFFDDKMNAKFQSIEAAMPNFKSPDYDGPPRHVIKYYNHKVNMAPYLFFLGCGTYDVYTKEVEYPDGDTFRLEILCLPGIVRPEDAETSLVALRDSIIWLLVSTGPEATEHVEARKKVYELIEKRDRLKENGDASTADELAKIRSDLKALMSQWGNTGYKYTGSVYREIAMENSNYGGMENVGNTTIISSRLTPSKWLVDGGYVYMEGVKIHEFYHNINGSQVTGQSPFEIWLNEAVTVHIQREREVELFGAAFMRLSHVMYAFRPGSGPLASDRSPRSMAVEPAGFNTTHELISAMTYSKAPEFVRMCQLILGKKKFDHALHNYHTKYAFSNATSNQWIAAMAEFAPENVDIFKMANGWLKRTGKSANIYIVIYIYFTNFSFFFFLSNIYTHQYNILHTGYPTVTVESMETSDEGLIVSLKQSGFKEHVEDERYPWIIPLDYAIVVNGKNIVTGLHILQTEEENLNIPIEGLEEGKFIFSIGRDWSFFGSVDMKCSTSEMKIQQALNDTDPVNRYLAFRSIVDEVKGTIISNLVDNTGDGADLYSNPSSDLQFKDYLNLVATILNDEKLTPSTKAKLLVLEESCPSRPDLQHYYQEIADCTTILSAAIYRAHGPLLIKLFDQLTLLSVPNRPQKEGLVLRSLKNLILKFLCKSSSSKNGHDVNDCVQRALNQLNTSTYMSEKSSAFVRLLELASIDDSVAENLQGTFNDVKNEWTAHPIGCEAYISAVCQADCKASPSYIKQLTEERFFQWQLAGHARTVARGWSGNRKRSLLTEDGLELTIELFFAVGKVNQMSAYSFLSAFGDVQKFNTEIQGTLVTALKKMQDGIDEKKQESLYKQLNMILSKLV